jgi:hypothetical protein
MRCFFLRNNLLPWFEANAMADANIISQETGNTKPSLSLSGCYVLCTSLSVNRLRRMANHRDDQYGQETRQTAAGIYKEDQESQARRALFYFQESWCLHFPGIMPRRSGPIMYETLWDIVVHLSSQREKASDPRDIALTL